MKKIFFVLTIMLVSGHAFEALAASSSTSASSTPQQTTEAAVRDYFSDIPVMIEIARCESEFRQFADSGNVLRGGNGGQMVGVFQFFDRYHLKPASDLGFDIETLDGNLAYARHIYETEGTNPWNAARDCWETPDQNGAYEVTESDEVLRQKIALLQQIIELLQMLIAQQEILGTR